MRFGLFTIFDTREDGSESQSFADHFNLIQEADGLGLDEVWLAEFHFRPGHSVLSAPIAVASAVAARTSRIRVGLAVQVLPLGNPLRVAEEAATVDHISKGRFDFGVGRSSFLEAYQGYNLDFAESRGRFSEALEIIQMAWGDEPFSYEGEYYTFHDVNVVPKPYQKPHPPIRVALESVDSFGLMGSIGFPIFIRRQLAISQLQDLLKEYDKARQEAGYSGPRDVILQIPAYVAETTERVHADSAASIRRRQRNVLDQLRRAIDQETIDRVKKTYDVSYDELIGRFAFGTPEEVVERLQQLQEELGLSGVALDMNPGGRIPHDRVLNSIRLLTEKVMPKECGDTFAGILGPAVRAAR